MDITTLLCRSLNKEQITEALTAHIKRYSGWEVSRVVFEGSEMTIYNHQMEDRHDGRVKVERMLLSVDLATGRELYGRMRHHDLGPVDLTIIHNVVR